MSKSLIMSDKIKSVRWAFDCLSWKPLHSQLLLSTSSIQAEEKERIRKFVFMKDAKQALIGRLLIRKFVTESTGIPWNEIIIKRDENGKPFLSNKAHDTVNFNISHNGRFVVLAGEVGGTKVGIDVMRTEYMGGKNVHEFFRLMNRQFSPEEWCSIMKKPGVKEQLNTFFRLWCLKESYVKTTGTGITVDLQEISFRINSDLKCNEFVEDTELYLFKEKTPHWLFQEMLLDEEHCVAIALQSDNNEKYKNFSDKFISMNFDDLVKNCKQVIPYDENYCHEFLSKE